MLLKNSFDENTEILNHDVKNKSRITERLMIYHTNIKQFLIIIIQDVKHTSISLKKNLLYYRDNTLYQFQMKCNFCKKAVLIINA